MYITYRVLHRKCVIMAFKQPSCWGMRKITSCAHSCLQRQVKTRSIVINFRIPGLLLESLWMTSMLFVIPRSGLKRKRSGRIFLRVHSFDWPYLEEEYIEYAFKWPVISRGSLHDLITWSTFGKHEYSSLLKNFASTSWKSISKLGNLIIFSPISQK